MTNAIELNHISKSFGEFSLKNVTLAIPAGTICGLVGENGAGKSTLIRILMGALRPDSGTAAALGVDVSAPEFLNAKEDIGVVLDEGCFPETLTAPQVGRVMAATYRRWEQDTFDAYCRRFALPEKTAFKDYSRGMKMKLTITVALSHQAQLLVLDEATAGLDPIVRDEILELFNEFTRDETHSVLISSTFSAIWKSSATTSPFSIRGGCCSARKRTPFWSNTASSMTRRSKRRPSCRKPSYPWKPRPTAASGRWCGGSWPRWASNWKSPPLRTSSSLW